MYQALGSTHSTTEDRAEQNLDVPHHLCAQSLCNTLLQICYIFYFWCVSVCVCVA